MSQAASHPKVCIIAANPIRGDLCNGIMIQSIFEGWDPSKLSHVHFMALNRLNPNVFSDSAAFRISLLGRTERLDENSCRPSGECSNRRVTRKAREAMRKRVLGNEVLRGFARGVHELWAANSGLLRKSLRRVLEEIRPDFVYLHVGSYWIAKVTVLACKTLKVPITLHVTDDFVSGLYEKSVWRAILRPLARKWFGEAVRCADLRIAISPAMAADFAQQYGGVWEWSTTLVDPDVYDPAPREPDACFRVVYAGSLGLNRADSLSALAFGVRKLGDQNGKKVIVDVWCSEGDKRTFLRKHAEHADVLNFCGWAKPAELPLIFHNADLLVHLESFREKDVMFTKLSLSTKISQYLMSARPVLAIAPEGLASVSVLQEAGACAGVCPNEPNAIHACLVRCLATMAELRTRGGTGLLWARENASVMKKRQHLVAKMKELCCW